MALPRKLKHMNLFANGVSWAGLIPEVTLPKLARKLEDYRAGGMDGSVGIDLGQENLEMEITAGGYMPDIMRQYGYPKVDGVMLRFAGSYSRDDTCEVMAIEVTVRGLWSEIDNGKAKPGDNTEVKSKARLSYYKLVENGKDIIEIDLPNFVFIVNGVDLLAEHRKAIGLA